MGIFSKIKNIFNKENVEGKNVEEVIYEYDNLYKEW